MATRRDDLKLVWIGDGDRYLIGVPARDLDESDITSLAGDGDRAALIAALTASGLYRKQERNEHG